MEKLTKPLVFLITMILLCSVIVRVTSGSETLSDYAERNPELAYATPEKTPDSQTDTIASPAKATAPPTPATAFSTPTPFIPLAEETESSTHYADGFFYQPLTDTVIAKITGISYPVAESMASLSSVSAVNVISHEEAGSLAISYDDLCYMNVLYYDFHAKVQTGELICNKKIAQDLIEIFYEMYQNEYQIEKIRLIDEYNGDDAASMLDNNTSCFNYRVVDGTNTLSKHAIGCAIDINPFYNPYVVFNENASGETYISPIGSEIYADRSKKFPYKIDENDLCYKLFKEHGFIWGGDWNSCKDYQHFQKSIE